MYYKHQVECNKTPQKYYKDSLTPPRMFFVPRNYFSCWPYSRCTSLRDSGISFNHKSNQLITTDHRQKLHIHYTDCYCDRQPDNHEITYFPFGRHHMIIGFAYGGWSYFLSNNIWLCWKCAVLMIYCWCLDHQNIQDYL